jgi:hypothetical protein
LPERITQFPKQFGARRPSGLVYKIVNLEVNINAPPWSSIFFKLQVVLIHAKRFME